MSKSLNQIVADFARIFVHQSHVERQRFRCANDAEDIQQLVVEIYRIVGVVFGGETDEIRDGSRWLIENRVQKTMIDSEIALGSRLEQLIDRNNCQPVGIED